MIYQISDGDADADYIDGGDGDDSIYYEGWSTTIDGGAGDDCISLSSYYDEAIIEYAAGDGNDTVLGFGGFNTLNITDGTYSTTKSGADVLVNVGSGSIRLIDASSTHIVGTLDAGNADSDINYINNSYDDVKLEGTDDDDYIFNTGEHVTIAAGGGNDTIEGSKDYGEMYLFSSADGRNVITNFRSNDTLRMTAGKTMTWSTVGNDVIVTLKGTNYTGTVTLQNAATLDGSLKKSGAYLTVETVNRITNLTNRKKVNGTANADYIINTGSNVTIDGKGGNDTIIGSDFGEMIYFGSDGGMDYVTDFGANDTIRITAGSLQSSMKSGDDVVLNVKGAKYSGAITLGGAADYNLVKRGAYIYADPVNYIVNRTDGRKVTGTSGRDFITNNAQRVSIQGGAGDDTFEGSDHAEMYLFSSADGNNVITNFGKNDSLRMTAGKTMTYATDGDDVIVTLKGTSYTGTVTLQNAADYSFKKSGSVLTVNSVNTINNAVDKCKITGTSDADYIYNSGANVTLEGKGGNDTIIGSDFGEMIYFGSDGGNDLVTNFGTNDTLRITAGAIASTLRTYDDVIVNVKGAKYVGAITLGGAASLNLKMSGAYVYADNVNYIVNRTDDKKVVGTSGRDWITNSGERVTIQSGAGNDTIEGCDLGELFLFSSADGNNVITNFGDGDSIKMTNGRTMTYSIEEDDVVVTLKGAKYTGKVTLKNAADINLEQSGNVLTVKPETPELINDNDNVKFTGTNGDDYMINTGTNVTINARQGDDTIEGALEGRELYQFGASDGNDVIYNFGTNDTLKITLGDITNYYASGSDYVVEVKRGTLYTGTVTLKDVGAIRVNDDVVRATRVVNLQLPADEYWFESESAEDELDELIGETNVDNALAMLDSEDRFSIASARSDQIIASIARHKK